MLINKWSGNGTSDISLYNTPYDDMFSFFTAHKECYVWGNGRIGSAILHYLEQSDMIPAGTVTSDTFDEFRKNYKPGETGVIVGVGEKIYEEIKPKFISFINENDIFMLPKEIRENLGYHFSLDMIERDFWLNIFVTNICNLNCKCCSTFAPICRNQPDYYIPEDFKKDLDMFKKSGFERLNVLKFTGGEPFRHKELIELFRIGREMYPDTTIECYTNGIIPSSLDSEMLKEITALDVEFVVTEYPLGSLDLTSFYERADKAGLKYNVIFSENIKYFSKRPLNFDRGTPKYKFASCPRYKFCDSLFMFKGKLYKCIYTFASQYFNKAFGTDLRITKSDYLDLNGISKKDVFEFCRTRIPFCGYCEPIEETVEWGLSDRDINEWT